MGGPKVKICGLTRSCDMDYINEAEPDYIGFVFARSRRQINRKEAEGLRRRLRRGIRAAGVFVDAPGEEILALVREGIIDAVQLHGRETPYYVNRLKEDLEKQGGCVLIKALPPETGGEHICTEYIRAGTDFFLFDSGGGTGKAFDWSLLPPVPYPYFLAGGLEAGNIERALREIKPYGVDVSSGVETDGVKDRDKILEIIRRIRNV